MRFAISADWIANGSRSNQKWKLNLKRVCLRQSASTYNVPCRLWQVGINVIVGLGQVMVWKVQVHVFAVLVCSGGGENFVFLVRQINTIHSNAWLSSSSNLCDLVVFPNAG